MTAHGAPRFSKRPPVGGHTGGLTGDSLQLTRGQPALLLEDKTTASGTTSCASRHGTQSGTNETLKPRPAQRIHLKACNHGLYTLQGRQGAPAARMPLQSTLASA